MPPVFINRPRFHWVSDRTCSRADHRRWECYNAVLYLVGGLIFIAGSILFFPALAPYENVGTWLFSPAEPRRYQRRTRPVSRWTKFDLR
ncbi:MAG: YrhK family protein [Desulfofustis sp. PB-SRB1]|jgi:hypothetical protein|nr:YrhK family protein [Desulfofustis sp. PB-SRB1]MBM1002206.1 YrhK family protein [Desulfofustis sp. PB-SRB1]HBH28218.1 hypothetical protein [Desulfofustis sp.]HBH32648.1 hypothetical protein [Desulfofustis sp.]